MTGGPVLVRADGARPRRRDLIRARLLRPATGVTLLVASAVIFTLIARPRPLLVWNASTSSPVGLYAVSGPTRPHRGEIVIAWPPADARRLAAARGYLPATVPLVKRVAAVTGDRVCAKGSRILINGFEAARRRHRDPSGRRLPWWTGCSRLASGDLLLLTPGAPDAFDGRYFGVTRAGEVIGKGKLLWPG